MREMIIVLSMIFLFPVANNHASSPGNSGVVHIVSDAGPFFRIEDAVVMANPGDTILVSAKKDGTPYQKVAVLVQKPNLLIKAHIEDAGAETKPVVLDGAGFDYSGIGATPRAIIQFEPGANGCELAGFVLCHAKNETYNAAGVRINQANNVTIKNCTIRDNDMGIMSNGEFARQTGADQMVDQCNISNNGAEEYPGYNHNLYLGGTSVTVQQCEIAYSVTGHNVKSRARSNTFIDNFVHDAANREFDIVDAQGNTDVSGGKTLFLRNKIVKNPNCSGNRGVIHFGKDGTANQLGAIILIENTIITPFISPVLDVSAGTQAELTDNVVEDAGMGQNGVIINLHGNEKVVVKMTANKIPKRFR